MNSMKISVPIISLGTPSAARLLSGIKQSRGLTNADVRKTVDEVLAEIRKNGDTALCAYTKKFDGISLTPKTIAVSSSEISAAAKKAPAKFQAALAQAAKRIRAYHKRQKSIAFSLKTPEGTLSQRIRPLTRVGVYVPGGHTIYPSTVLMDVIPAQIAGVKEIAVATPPRGGLDPKIACALELLHVNEVYRVGGAQAIAALAFGTRTIKQVDKIVGPGNMYVAIAKKAVYGVVDIDSIAGPSEVVVLADSSANPAWVALDLLAQAEHGSGSESAFCVTENRAFAEKVKYYVEEEAARSPVSDVFKRLKKNGICICVAANRKESIDFVNECAPEHLQIITKTYKTDVEKITNAAVVFCGPFTPVALGDYYIGTNHVLPTGGAARFASPLGVDSFVKRMSVAEVSQKGLRGCAHNVSVLARAENFVHHALSVERRVGIGG